MKIIILAPQGVQSLDIVGPAEVFWEAARRLGNPDAYRVQVMGTSDEPIRGTGALRFLPDRTIRDPDEPIDTLLVAGDPSFQDLAPGVSEWLARRAPESRRYGSICTGVFLLAAAGLLEGKQVTTHWKAHPAKAAWPKSTSLEDISTQVGDINVPTLVIARELDRVDPPIRLQVELLARIPQATMHVLPGTGHLSMLESPDALAALVANFCNALGSSGR